MEIFSPLCTGCFILLLIFNLLIGSYLVFNLMQKNIGIVERFLAIVCKTNVKIRKTNLYRHAVAFNITLPAFQRVFIKCLKFYALY